MGVAMQMRVERVNPNEGRYANRNRILLLRRLRKRVRRYDGGGAQSEMLHPPVVGANRVL